MNNNDSLSSLREEIDALDDQIITLLAERMEVSRKIGEVKKAKNTEPLDTKRWNAVVEARRKKAKLLQLPEAFIDKLFTLIHEQSLKVQETLRNSKKTV